jgi:hypothetical protein
MDRRLTLQDIKVRVALASFASKDKQTVWPHRKTLAAMTGMHINNISAATTRLESFGWLTKRGNGGRSCSCFYELAEPKSPADSATDLKSKSKSIGRAKTEAKTQTDSACQTIADSARGKEVTKEEEGNRQNQHSILESGMEPTAATARANGDARSTVGDSNEVGGSGVAI